MTLRSALLRSLIVVVAGSFGAAARVTDAAADRTETREADTETHITPPGPLGPPASAGRQAVVTGVGPGPADDADD
jgi:hypothetical protein